MVDLADLEIVLDEVADGEGVALQLRRRLRRALVLEGDRERHLERDEHDERDGHEGADDAESTSA